MAYLAPSSGRGQGQKLVPGHNSDQSTCSPLIPRPSSRRTLSLSSSPSFSSSNSSFSLDENNIIANNSPFSPTTPLHFSGQIPFSWEKIPGIPKNKQLSKQNNNDPSLENISLLPLPPAAKNPTQKHKNMISPKKHYTTTTASFRKDPFFAAFVECSKGSDDKGSIGNVMKSSRISRTLSDGLGFVSMYTNSCKTTCAVSKSMIYLPRSSQDIYHTTIRRSR